MERIFVNCFAAPVPVEGGSEALGEGWESLLDFSSGMINFGVTDDDAIEIIRLGKQA